MPLTTVSPGLLDSNAQYNSFKNRLINGQMVIDQRYAGASVNLTGNNYTIDRWNTQQPAQNIATQRNAGSVTPPVGFTNYLGFTVALAATPTSSNIFQTQQIIEGFNAADLGWGTASASTVALSFWVRSSLTGTFSGSLSNDSNARSYPFTFAINAANTWEYKTVTIPGDTTGTWLTNNGAGIKVGFSLGMGSTYSGTANTWQAGTFLSATGATNLVATSGATFYITSVQLEKGSTATSFDYRPYGTELALCQRYYYITDTNSGFGTNGTTTQSAFKTRLPVTMRTAPSLTMPSSSALNGPLSSGAKTSATAPTAYLQSANEIGWYVGSGFTGLTVGEFVWWTGSAIQASSEL
jgi:hypothetical protein